MRDEIKALEKRALPLDPGSGERISLLSEVQRYAETYLQRSSGLKTFVPDGGRTGIHAGLIGETPSSIGELLDEFDREVNSSGIHLTTGGHLGYIPGGGLYPSALGDYLAAVSNRYSGVAYACPGAAEMEGALLRWMCRLVGYGEGSGGDLCSGGSLATLSAMVAARDAHGIDHSVIPDACIYLTAQAHHCVGTALHTAGLGAVQKRTVPMDGRFRMDAGELERMIAADREAGLAPWLVVASAGTTDTGAVDPLETVAAVCRRYGTWFHLDAAYGGFFLLCDEGRDGLRGMAAADSIVMDPHKGLGLPFGTGAVLVRDRKLLARSFTYYADYMQDAIHSERDPDTPYSPADYSVELTRHFRGPRMWLPLRLFGLEPFRAMLAAKILLARYFHRQIARMEGFEAGPSPDLSIVTFRCVPAHGDADEANRRLLAAVHGDGKVFITSTLIDGKFTLRMAALSFRTRLEHVDYLLAFLENAAGQAD